MSHSSPGEERSKKIKREIVVKWVSAQVQFLQSRLLNATLYGVRPRATELRESVRRTDPERAIDAAMPTPRRLVHGAGKLPGLLRR